MEYLMVVTYFLFLLVPATNALSPWFDEDEPTSLWYVWFIVSIIVTVGLFVIMASCYRLFCKSTKSPVPAFAIPRFDVAVIDVDNETNPTPFPPYLPRQPPAQFYTVGLSNPFSPPPYNLFSLESPPQYDEALKMPTDKGTSPTIVPDSQPQVGVAHGDTELEHPRSLGTEDREDGQFDCGRMGENGTWESQDSVACEEEQEDPPEYHLYDPISEDNFTEISLTEHSPECHCLEDSVENPEST